MSENFSKSNLTPDQIIDSNNVDDIRRVIDDSKRQINDLKTEIDKVKNSLENTLISKNKLKTKVEGEYIILCFIIAYNIIIY